MPVIVKTTLRRQNKWLEIFADEGDSLRLPVEQVPAWAVQGAAIDPPQWTELCAKAAYFGLYDKALKILTRREHFIMELRRKLSQRERDRSLVSSVINKLIEQHYLDDERAAGLILSQLMLRGGMGKGRLKSELLKRGCAKELADRALSEHAGDIDDAEEARGLLTAHERQFTSKLGMLRRKLAAKGTDERKLEFELRQKLGAAVLNYLAGRGFTSEEIRRDARSFVDGLIETDKN